MTRHRRAVEAGQLATRGCGIVLTAMLLTGFLDLFPDGMPRALKLTCLSMAAVMAIAEVLGLMNFRSPAGIGYAPRSVIQVVARFGCAMPDDRDLVVVPLILREEYARLTAPADDEAGGDRGGGRSGLGPLSASGRSGR
jgi:hypothetical protein